jgi:FkbM family methyltransferase
MTAARRLPDVLAQKIARRLKLTCSLPHSFSQEGEDVLLDRFFEQKPRGFYVDIGAHHPIRFSNTHLFYRRGWRGINVDAMPGSMKEFAKLRPEDQNVEALVSDKCQRSEFFLFNEPALNTCEPALARQRDGLSTFRLTGSTVVESQTLSAILDRYLPARQAIDFLSVDVEGMDLAVLRSNDWDRFRPTVIVAEDLENSSVMHALDSPIAHLLETYGYSLFAKTVNTIFFRQM